MKNSKTRKNPVFDTLEAAASFYGTKKSVVGFARDQGAPGCRGSRIYDNEFGPWFREWIKTRQEEIEATGAKTKEDWQLLILAEKYRAEKRDNDIADNMLVSLDWAHAEIRAQANAAQGVFNSLPSRMAMDLAGLKPFEIEERLKMAIDEGIKKMGEEPSP